MDEILNLIGSVSEGFPSYSFLNVQRLCSREMTKFSEIELFLTAEKKQEYTYFWNV